MGNLEFAIIETQAEFENRVSTIPETWVVFIKDTQQIWTHGLYFGATNSGDFDKLLSKINGIEDVLKEIGTSDEVKQSHITLTQEEYDYRLDNGTIYDDQFYYIIEND